MLTFRILSRSVTIQPSHPSTSARAVPWRNERQASKEEMPCRTAVEMKLSTRANCSTPFLRASTDHKLIAEAFLSVPGMAQFLRVEVPPRVFTAKCGEPQAATSNGRRGGSGVPCLKE